MITADNNVAKNGVSGETELKKNKKFKHPQTHETNGKKE